MFDSKFEPTISEIMREPMVRALMKADRVDAHAFEARLRLMARDARTAEDDDGEAEEPAPQRRFLPQAVRSAAERCCWA